MKNVSVIAIAFISMFVASQAFSFCDSRKLVDNEKKKIGKVENLKVGTKLKEYGTLVTYSFTDTSNIGGNQVKYSMSGYTKYDESCKSFEGDGVVVY